MVTTSERDRWARKRAQWARENSTYLHRLLSERQPGFAAALRSAELHVDLELSREATA